MRQSPSHRNMLCILLTVAFVGVTSCGDSEEESDKDLEIAAMRKLLAEAKNQQTVHEVQTITAVSTSNMTSVVVVNGSSSTGTAAYTVTSGSTSTSTASRM